MQLSQLMQPFQLSQKPQDDFAAREVSGIYFDSRSAGKDSVFVAVRGEKIDSHQYVAAAARAGAIGLVVEDPASIPKDFRGAVLLVGNSRIVLNKLAAEFYAHPSRRLFCAGVTGTNGKTTITYLIEALLNHAGRPTGVIGTINHHLQNHVWATDMTTPNPVEFQKRLKEFVDLGAQAVALEVSSHALAQSRVDEVSFDAGVFTNLTRDHLDYHGTMGEYFAAKEKLFSGLLGQSAKKNPVAIVNIDDEYGRKINSPKTVKLLTYGADAQATLRFTVLQSGFSGTRFELQSPQGEQEFEIMMPGLHNVANATAAIGVAISAGVSLSSCADALKSFRGVPGRLQSVENHRDLHIYVDYAHTPDALRTVLHYLGEIRRHAKLQNKVITAFGCGGDRDKGKRPLMMQAALDGSDLVVLTSDNPRSEDPDAILNDASNGISAEAMALKVHREVDRKKAIALALSLAQKGDVILIAGKGHENYQQIGMTKFPFSDASVVTEVLA